MSAARTTCSRATSPVRLWFIRAWAASCHTNYGPRNNLPPYVCIPSQPTTYAGTGYLSSAYSPFSLGSDPADGNFNVQDLNLPGGVDPSAFQRAATCLRPSTSSSWRARKADGIEAMDTFYHRAYGLISSQKAREAFNINAEPAKIRDEYGRNAAGQRMLLARRLVAAGVRFVSLHLRRLGHAQRHQGGHGGPVTAVRPGIRHADSRPGPNRLLGSTLVMISSEFWANAQGQRHCRSRPLAESLHGGPGRRRHQEGIRLRFLRFHRFGPENDPLTVEDLAMTLYNQLGIDGVKNSWRLATAPSILFAKALSGRN